MKLMVSCVGAYGDSGLGSGGLFIVDTDKKDAINIDSIDTTGLFRYDEKYFRYTRGVKKLICYTKDGIISELSLNNAVDVHDIYVNNDTIMVVSTGNNEVQYYNIYGEFIKKWNPGGEGDAWHLNCLFGVENDIFISAFGDFSTHREWNGNASGKGIVFSIKENRIIIDGLSGPHNPRRVNNQWWICDSHKNEVKIFDSSDFRLISIIGLDGFTRGLYDDGGDVWVGVSANRKDVNSLTSKIVRIDKYNFSVKDEIEIPLPEIYDVIGISEEIYESIRDAPERFIPLQSLDNVAISNFNNQIHLMEKEIIGLKKRLKKRSLIFRLKNKVKGIISDLGRNH